MTWINRHVEEIKHVIQRALRSGVLDIGFASFLTRLTALAQRILLARILGAENIGHIAVVSSVLSLIRLPAGAGTFTVVNKLVAENSEDISIQQKVIGTSLWVNLVTTLLVGVVAWYVLSGTAWVNDIVAKGLLLMLLPLLPLMIFVEIMKNALMGQRRMKICARIDITISILAILGVVPMAYYWSINGWLYNQVLLMILAGLLLCWALRSILSLKWNNEFAKKIASFGTFAFLGQLVGVLILQFDTLCISKIIKDSSITGIYNTAALIAQQLMFIPISITTIVFPFVAQNKNDIRKLKKRYSELTIIIGSLAIIMAISVWVLCPFFFPWFGRDFVQSVWPFRILAIGFIAQSLYVLDNTYLDALGRTDITFVTGLVAMVINIVLNISFITRWGMIGAAWATCTSMICSLILRRIVVHQIIFKRQLIR